MHVLALCALTLVAARNAPPVPPFEGGDDAPVRRVFNPPPDVPHARTTTQPGQQARVATMPEATDDRRHEVGKTFHVILDLPPKTVASIKLLPDGYAGQLELSKIPKDLTKQLLGQKDVHAMAIPAQHGDGAMVFLAFEEPVRSAHLKHDTSRLDITLGAANIAQTLATHIVQHIPPPDVAGDDAKKFTAAESLMEDRNFIAARREFEALSKNYPLKPWVTLRLADIAYLEKGDDVACDIYQKVATAYDTRAAGIEASLRMFVLDCPHQQQSLIWTALLSRTNTDDAVGRWIASEARWALQYIRDPVELSQALRWGEKLLGKPLWNTLLARLLRTGTPLAVAEASHSYRAAIKAHHDAADLNVWMANSYCNLDLQREAAALVPGKAKQSWLASAAQCEQVGTFALPKSFRDIEDIKKRLSDVRSRTKAVEEAISVAEAAESVTTPKEAP